MLEDKGISLEGKRCLITGSDSVSTLICFAVRALLSYSFNMGSFCSVFLSLLTFIPPFSFLPDYSPILFLLHFFPLMTFLSNFILSLPLLQSFLPLLFPFFPCCVMFLSSHLYSSFLFFLSDFYSSGRETNWARCHPSNILWLLRLHIWAIWLRCG